MCLRRPSQVSVVDYYQRFPFTGDLRGKKSCHSGYVGDFAGHSAPAHILKQKELINEPGEIDTFFSESCAPGAPLHSKSCQLCVGNIKSGDDQVKEATKCRPTNAEHYNGGKGALRYFYTVASNDSIFS